MKNYLKKAVLIGTILTFQGAMPSAQPSEHKQNATPAPAQTPALTNVQRLLLELNELKKIENPTATQLAKKTQITVLAAKYLALSKRQNLQE